VLIDVEIRGKSGDTKLMSCRNMELKKMNIIMGPQRSGKTTLLRLLFNAVYARLNGLDTTRDLYGMAYNYLTGKLRYGSITLEICNEEKYDYDREECREAMLKLECTGGEEVSCDVEGESKLPFDGVIFIPTEFEALIKYALLPLSEPYETLRTYYLNLLRSGVKLEKPLGILDEAFKEIIVKRNRIIEVVDGAEIDISYSSSYVTTLYLLRIILDKVPDNSLILIDNIDSYLHPEAMEKLALMLWKLAEKNIVVVATHDLIFEEALIHADNYAKKYGVDVHVDFDDISLTVLKPWGECVKKDPRTSVIDTYTDVFRDLYPELYG
jgi:energy-coupling factor transporter ATP-binding protein EcfA2